MIAFLTHGGMLMDHKSILIGPSPVDTTKALCGEDLPIDLSNLSASFSNDLAVKTFMPGLSFQTTIGCSAKPAVMNAFLSHLCTPDEARRCKSRVARPPREDLSQRPFKHLFHRLVSPSSTKAVDLRVSYSKKPVHNGIVSGFGHVLLRNCVFTLHTAAH